MVVGHVDGVWPSAGAEADDSTVSSLRGSVQEGACGEQPGITPRANLRRRRRVRCPECILYHLVGTEHPCLYVSFGNQTLSEQTGGKSSYSL